MGGLISGAGSYINRAFGGSEGVPTYQAAPLDQGTQDLINQSIERSHQTPEQFAQQQNQGISELAGKAQQNEVLQGQKTQASGGGIGQDSINNAINKQYSSYAGADVGRLEKANEQAAIMQKNQALQIASANAMARKNIEVSTYQQLMQAQNATETARAQVLSSVIGAAGTGIGMYAANRKSSRPSSQNNQTSNFGSQGQGPYGSQPGMLGADTTFQTSGGY